MRYILSLLCLFYLVNFSFSGIPLNPKFEHITVDQGLSTNRITRILQDSQRFMWFGSGNGLHKFDGYKFTIYKPNPDDSLSIDHAYIYSLYKDNNKNIWIGTYGGGLYRFERGINKFVKYINNPDDPESLSNNFVSSICQTEEDSVNALWVGTRWGGLNKLNIRNGKFERYFLSSGIIKDIDAKIFDLCPDRQGNIWIGTENSGLIKFDPENLVYTQYLSKNSGLIGNAIKKLYCDQSDNLWVGTTSGLNRFNITKNEFNQFTFNKNNNKSISHNHVLSIYEDSKENLWIGTYNGLNLFDETTNEFNRFNSDRYKSDKISNDYINDIYEDHSGNLWIATQGGINKISPQTNNFNHVQIELNNYSDNDKNRVRAIQEDYNDSAFLWIGTAGAGLIGYNRDDNRFRQYFGKNSTEFVRSIYQSNIWPDKVWIATWGSGLLKIDKNSKGPPQKAFWLRDKKLNDGNFISTIYPLSEKKILLGTGIGLFQYNIESQKYFKLYPQKTNRLKEHPNVTEICRDRSGTLWIGTYGDGLKKLVFPPGINDLARIPADTYYFRHEPNNPNSLSSDIITCIFEDYNGTIWIGTLDGGLNKIQNKSHTKSTVEFIHYRQKDGLPSDAIVGILEDNNKLWISTKNGLSRFDPVDETFTNFDKSDGLQSNEFNRFSYYKNKRGELFFGGVNGFNFFNPANIIKNSFLPEVVITDFRIYNKSAPHLVSETNEIVLSHDQTIFTLEFAALDYTNPKKNKYLYKMEGMDPDWVLTDASRRYVTYTHLDPGKYVFQVKGSNNDGIWNEEGTTVNIIITPPWWKTWWAYCLYAIIFIGLFLSIRTYELNRQKLKHNLELEHEHAVNLEKVNQMKSRFFANISHEFRTPLTLISGPARRLLEKENDTKQKEDLQLIEDNARRMNKLVEMYLDLARLESGILELDKKEQDIIPILKSVLATFQSMAESVDIELVFRTTVAYAKCSVDKEKFELIFINLLNNAIKFTKQKGKITLSVENSEAHQELIIAIKDSGIGIAKDKLDRIFEMYYQVDNEINQRISGTGIGLAMVKELVTMHGGTINVDSILGQGTTCTIIFPLISIQPVNVITEHITENIEADECEDRDGRKELILIVEDNKQMSDYIKSHIAQEYHVRTAVNGKDGFEKAVQHNPDLIISDVMMPEMDGYEFSIKLKEDIRTSHIPVILLTAKIQEKDMLKGLRTGADSYLRKPFSARELMVRINNLTENRKRLHQKFQTDKLTDLKEYNVTSADEKFLDNCLEFVDKHMCDRNFNTVIFATGMALSRTQLHRKLKSLTGLSASQYVNIIRLKKARRLLGAGFGNISQVAYECGFASGSYFTALFKEMYKITPQEFLKQPTMQ